MYVRRRGARSRPVARFKRRQRERRASSSWIDQIVMYLVLLVDILVLRPLTLAQDTAYALVASPTSHRILIRTALLTGLHAACVGVALIAYGGFYYAWVPDVSVKKDVWLQYENGQGTPLARPLASVLLDGGPSDLPVWQIEPTTPLFMENQEYDVSLEMRVLLTPKKQPRTSHGSHRQLYDQSRPLVARQAAVPGESLDPARHRAPLCALARAPRSRRPASIPAGADGAGADRACPAPAPRRAVVIRPPQVPWVQGDRKGIHGDTRQPPARPLGHAAAGPKRGTAL